MLVASLLVACHSPDPRGPRTDDVPIDTDTDTDGVSGTGDTAVPPPGPVTESFVYAAPPVDVLFVIDSSSSMTGRIAELTGALAPLVDVWLARTIDFQVGVVDIDESNVQGRLLGVDGQRWAEPSSASPGLLLQQLVEAVGDPSTNEAGLASSYRALQLTEAGGYNEGFLRSGSRIAIIVITDEADQTDPGVISPPDYVTWLLGLRPDPALVAFHAIAATEEYLQVTNATGGVPWNVNNTPYGPALEAITQTLEGDNAFALSEDPDVTTITARVVELSGVETILATADLDYHPGSREVDLGSYFPATGATVEITYVPQP